MSTLILDYFIIIHWIIIIVSVEVDEIHYLRGIILWYIGAFLGQVYDH